MRPHGIWTSREVQNRLADESRWMTSPSEASRWRFGTWVDVYAWGPARLSVYGSVGMPAWMLPWNRPQKKVSENG